MSKIQMALEKTIAESGLNISQISKLSGINDRLLYDIKNGKKGMTLSTIIKICDSLEIPYDDLINALIEDTKTADSI